MKVVVKYNGERIDELNEILLYLKGEGYDDFIIFSSFDASFSSLESEIFKYEVRAAYVKTPNIISTYDALKSIKGSLGESFLIVYSSEIEKFDLSDAHLYHKTTTELATLLSTEKITAGIFLEAEVFDYMIEPKHFEREVIKRIFEDGDASVYNVLSYEIY